MVIINSNTSYKNHLQVARAKAQKEANDLIAESYTPEILFEHFLEKWNGELPKK